MGKDTAIGIVFAETLACGDRQGGKASLFKLSSQAERHVIEQGVCRAVVLKYTKEGAESIVCKMASDSLTPIERAYVCLGNSLIGGAGSSQKPTISAPYSWANFFNSSRTCIGGTSKSVRRFIAVRPYSLIKGDR